MFLNFVLLTLVIAIVLYVLLGGADYGAGILLVSPFSSKKKGDAIKTLVSKAIGPIWEANHMWLILTIVILFVAFPSTYSDISRYLHWPLVFVLLGIVARGCSFTFLHYDPIKDSSQWWYEKIFIISSLWTPFWLGVCLGAVSSGEIYTNGSIYEMFFASWLNWYSFFLGLFCTLIFASLASLYLLGETNDKELRKELLNKAYFFFVAMMITGGFVFISSYFTEAKIVLKFFKNFYSISFFILANFLLLPLVYALRSSYIWTIRTLVATIVSCIVLGWISASYPVLIHKVPMSLTISQASAPKETLCQLSLALLIGLLAIGPSLIFLMKVFKGKKIS